VMGEQARERCAQSFSGAHDQCGFIRWRFHWFPPEVAGNSIQLILECPIRIGLSHVRYKSYQLKALRITNVREGFLACN
jgi:hypothetical protein